MALHEHARAFFHLQSVHVQCELRCFQAVVSTRHLKANVRHDGVLPLGTDPSAPLFSHFSQLLPTPGPCHSLPQVPATLPLVALPGRPTSAATHTAVPQRRHGP